MKKWYSFNASHPEKVLIVNDQMFKGTSSKNCTSLVQK